jgi:uncharacterized protein
VSFVLLDAGPMVALLDRADRRHAQCVELLHQCDGRLLTCEAALTEACYILRSIAGAAGRLLENVRTRRFEIGFQLAAAAQDVSTLLRKFADRPISLADACLVAMANLHQTDQILTLDSDFRVYRWGRNKPFDLLLDV